VTQHVLEKNLLQQQVGKERKAEERMVAEAREETEEQVFVRGAAKKN
jgi:hypothetical protein